MLADDIVVTRQTVQDLQKFQLPLTFGRKDKLWWKKKLRRVARGTSAGRPESRRHLSGKAAGRNERVAPKTEVLYK